MLVDTRGLACPQPVLMAKNALAKESKIDVLVDNNTAKNNVVRFATSQGAKATVEAADDVDEYLIHIEK